MLRSPPPDTQKDFSVYEQNVLAAKLVLTELSDRKLKPFSPQPQQVSCEPCAVLTTSAVGMLCWSGEHSQAGADGAD